MNLGRTITILKSLVRYYTTVRQVGHTSAILKGALNDPKAVVVVADSNHAQSIQEFAAVKHSGTKPRGELMPIQTRTLDQISLRPEALLGMNVPLVVDHYALLQLLQDSVEVIEHLHAHNLRLSDKIVDIQRIVAR
jgi:hypothetical protein